jgi:hypothetical protein
MQTVSVLFGRAALLQLPAVLQDPFAGPVKLSSAAQTLASALGVERSIQVSTTPRQAAHAPGTIRWARVT